MTESKVTTTATLRPFGCELTTLSQADGSAIWKSGGTSVLASVHGPAAPRQASLEESHAQVSFVVAGTETICSDQEEWEPLLRNVLERCIHVQQYPRSIVQIVCHVFSNDGSVLAACLHASVAALMDAGVAMRQLPTAAAIRVVCKNPADQSYHLSLDPDTELEQDMDQSSQEEPTALLCLIVAQTSSTQSAVLAAHSRGGRAPLAVWPTVIGLAERARPALTNFMKMALQQKMQTRSNES